MKDRFLQSITIALAVTGCFGAKQTALAQTDWKPTLQRLAKENDPQAAIAEGFQAEVSPMPPMGVLLNQQEMRDIMAYLMTLK